MKAGTLLDSAVFQLTPTRTRCDLVIIANGKKEKLASGLLNPFLAHLKTAQDQISKGGYSITLEPGSEGEMAWFTKGTLERFVRFVSNPEILERVDTIESEMLQIDEAIAVQSIENLKINPVEDLQSKPARNTEVLKPGTDSGAEKAIVLFKVQPVAHPPEANGSAVQEENSKVQLLRVLDTRKAVLRKEQGMAFARAVAAGFDLDQMSDLIEFAECFGASRLMKACLKYMELWKQKHETGQWVEVEAAEIMSAQSDFISLNASGIMLSADTRMQGSNFGVELDSSGKASPDTGDGSSHIGINGDKRPADSQVPGGLPEQFQGQFHHPMYGQWSIQAPPGVPMFPSYPLQSMPYYQNYPGGQFYPPPYASSEDFNKGNRRRRNKSHSIDDKDGFTGSEDTEEEDSIEKEGPKGYRSRRKGRHSGRKKSDGSVARNVNASSSSIRTSGSDTETSSEHERTHSHEKKRKDSVSSSKGDRLNSQSSKEQDDDVIYRQNEDHGNWDAFQNFLLREKEESESGRGVFSGEKEISVKKKNITGEPDPLNRERNVDGVSNHRISDFDAAGNPRQPLYRSKASNGELALFQKGQNVVDMHIDIQGAEMESGPGGYRRMSGDDFIVNGQYTTLGNANSFSDPFLEGNYAHSDKNKGLSDGMKDESFIVPHRSSLSEQMGTGSGNAIDMVAEFPSAIRTGDGKSLIGYEPDGLSLIPERTIERESIGYDPAMDYEMEVHAKFVQENGKDVDANNAKDRLVKSDKEKKATLEKKKIVPTIRRNQPSRLPTDSRQRAERLQSFKSEIQKVKKEKEEEQLKRLEAIKLERQKRIAARSGLNGSQSTSPSAATKHSPTSKFSDSPVRRSVGATPKGSPQTSGPNRAGSKLSRSVSSLPDQKKAISGRGSEIKTESEPRRLSEPAASNERALLQKIY